MINPKDTRDELARLLHFRPLAGVIAYDIDGNRLDCEDIVIKRYDEIGNVLEIIWQKRED